MAAESTFQSEFQQLGQDLKSYLETRYEMLRAELTAALVRLRSAALLFGLAAVLAIVGLILGGFCVSLAIALSFGAFTNQVGLVWGFLCTAGGSFILAIMIAVAGMFTIRSEAITPKRTLRVLRRDGESFRQAGSQNGDESETRRRA